MTTAAGYRFIDSDTHLTEPADVWTARVPKRLLDRVPHMVRSDEGQDIWLLEGERIYTVGLTALNKPEVVVTGMRTNDAVDLLNDVAYHLTHADPPRHGEQIPWPGRALFEVVRVAEPTAHLNVAASIYGPRVQAIQLVHADDRGHWPWDVGWRGMRGGQPVLGARAPQAVTT